MSKHTTFKIGGPADYFIIVETKEELRSILNYANYKIIGNGSNLIVSDKGYRGTIFKLGQAFGRISYEKPFITAGAAITITELLKYCRTLGLTGLEGMAGIPATIGGTIYMNAGYTRSIANSIVEVRGITSAGIDFRFNNISCYFGYRSSIFQKTNAIITEVILKVEQTKSFIVNSNIRKLLDQRKATQPIQFPSCGSIFKKANIDKCKGMRNGDIEVSTKCSSFFINHGKGTAKDIVALIELVRAHVGSKIELEAEIIGEGYES